MKFIIMFAVALLAVQAKAEDKVRFTLKDQDASQLYRILNLETTTFGAKRIKVKNGKFSILCLDKENVCEIEMGISAMSRDKTVYLYRNADAELIYNALTLREIDGTLGKLKIWVSSEDTFEIFCSQSAVPEEKNPFSCMISLR